MNTHPHASSPLQAEPHEWLTLEDLCRTCAVHDAFVMSLLEEGAIDPAEGHTPDTWRFTSVQVHHVSVAWRLQRDLGVNPAGAALALQLLDEVRSLRAQLATLTVVPEDDS